MCLKPNDFFSGQFPILSWSLPPTFQSTTNVYPPLSIPLTKLPPPLSSCVGTILGLIDWSTDRQHSKQQPQILKVCITEVQCTLQRGELAVCTNNGTRGQSIARIKLPDIAKTQASFNSLFYITKYIQIIITISKQVPNKIIKFTKFQYQKYS